METSLSIGEPGKPETWIEAHGEQSDTGIRVTSDGQIVTLGGPGVLVRDATVYMSGKPVLRPTAIEAWQSTLEAIEIVQDASSDQGFLFEIVTGNLCIAMLVTGYEAYCKTRFVELDAEGVEPDFDAFATVFLRRSEIENGQIQKLRDQAAANRQSPIEYVVRRRLIDFQDYARCRRAYAKAYGLSFGGTVGIPNTILESLQKTLKYRHQIVHVSATTSILNHAELPGAEPVMATKDFVSKTANVFKGFIGMLHAASHELNAPPH